MLLPLPLEQSGKLCAPANRTEERIKRWLEVVGWQFNPFAKYGTWNEPLTQAEDENADSSRWYSGKCPVIPSSWRSPADSKNLEDDDLDYFDDLSANPHALVWGHMGAGKSATKLILKAATAGQGTVVTEYRGSLIVKSRPDQYVDRMIGLIMRAALPLMDEMNLPPAVLLATHSDPIASLITLVSGIAAFTHRPVFILIDNLDVSLDDQADMVETAYQRIKPFLTPGLLDIPGLFLKIFLPEDAQCRIIGALPDLKRRFDTDRLKSFSLSWTANALLEMLHTRLNLVTSTVSLDEISSNEEGMPFALEEALVERALQQSGPPRALLRLVQHMIAARVRHDRFETEYRLTLRDLDDACAEIGASVNYPTKQGRNSG